MSDPSSETFGTLPHDAETFGAVRKDSEGFRTLRNAAARTDQHTLTVREVARLFEQAGVPRTERSIVNWCQPNHQGIARLDAFFDTNERKYFVTPQSVTAAVGEEQAKQAASGAAPSAPANDAPKTSERSSRHSEDMEAVEALRAKLRDSEITNRVKDQFIGMLEKDREKLAAERENYVRELIGQSHRIGQLESQLHQIGAPAKAANGVPLFSERFGNLPHQRFTDDAREAEPPAA